MRFLVRLSDRQVRVEGYTKKLQTRYNKGVQANCKAKGENMSQKAHSLSHTKWMCKYHIVFTPKYRRKVIYNQYRSSLGEIFHRLCSYKGVEIIEGHLMPDHVHMLISIPPRISVSSFMGYLKGKSALMMFDKHANLKYKFGNRHFWAEGYYVSTVGLNEITITKYIQKQEKITEMNLFIELTEADKKYQDIKDELVKEIAEIDIKLNQINEKVANLNKMAEVLINLKSEDISSRKLARYDFSKLNLPESITVEQVSEEIRAFQEELDHYLYEYESLIKNLV